MLIALRRGASETWSVLLKGCSCNAIKPSAITAASENTISAAACARGRSKWTSAIASCVKMLPRAQLDYYPTAGSSPIAYALADRGARLLIQRDGVEFANVEWSRKNRKAGRPFIEHQLEIVDFSVALQLATGARRDVQFIHPNDIIAAFPEQTRAARNPLSLRVKLSHQGAVHEIGLVPDLAFGLQFPDGSRHSFMVEIDRGTMPITRSDFLQTSFERKMRAYLTAHAGKQHEKHFGWKTFRVLTVTTDQHRMQSMMEALRKLRIPHSPGASLFFFTTRDELRTSDPLTHEWQAGNGRAVRFGQPLQLPTAAQE